jgi:hypothetical protein
MTIRLLDFAANEYFVEIPDDTEQIEIDIVSGDMILQSPVYYDTCKEDRALDFYDGTIVLNKEDFSKLNEIEEAFEILYINE